MEKVTYTSQPNSSIVNVGFIEKILSAAAGLAKLYAIFVIFYLFLYGLLDMKDAVVAREGMGFNNLRPYMAQFKAFRNLGYIGYIVILVIGGLASLITRKPALNKSMQQIIISLVLLTFSYAIAALLLDIVSMAKYLSLQM